MFNPRAPAPQNSIRSLHLRRALAAAYEAGRRHPPAAPTSLPELLDACRGGVQAMLARPGCRDAIAAIRARVFQAPGSDTGMQRVWLESVATAVFSARVAQLTHAAVPASFLGGLLHRAGEALALKTLVRVELEYRIKLDSASRREWCVTHGPELTQRLIDAWDLSPEIEACMLEWMRFGEPGAVSAEGTALYFGRWFAVELLHPEFCVPGALDHAAADLGLSAGLVARVREEGSHSRELIRAFD
jgi:HDOD domain